MNSHVLGLKWNHGSDSLVVSRGVNRELQTFVTQQTVLSFVSSVFEPFDLVAPYPVKARLLLKGIWRITEQKCDDPLPEALQKQFIDWHSSVFVLGELVIRRCYFINPCGQCSSICLEIAHKIIESQKTEIACVFRKARVASMKDLSISKLELQAALLLSRLKENILQALSIDVTCTLCEPIAPRCYNGFTPSIN